MYDIRQFKPILYLVLMLGLTGFCMAGDELGLWGMAVLGVGLNAWLVKTNRFHPFPRWLANGVTVIMLIYIVARLRGDGAPPPLIHVGEFLVFLHLIKLYEQRGNRDYAQLLILSLLLMVAAAINSSTLGFGLLMLVYLALSLYCCLLFHLKVEADRARKALAIPEDRVHPSTLRQDQRFLPKSMRRLTALVWIVSVCTGTLVFLFFPRGTGAGLLGQFQLKTSTALTGISDHLGFDQITRIKQNDETVAHVTVWENEKPVQGGALYLRGLTVDTYAPDAYSSKYGGTPRRQWLRSLGLNTPGMEVSQDTVFTGPRLPPTKRVWRQHVLLQPTGSRFLFALPGLMYYETEHGRLIAVAPGRGIYVRDFPADDSIQLPETLTQPLEYDVYSTNQPQPPTPAMLREARSYQSRSNRDVLAEVRKYTLDLLPQDLADRLRADPKYRIDPSRWRDIAHTFETHLRTRFSYTLDLTGSERQFRGLDPVVAFLTRVKKGHCEYFASAMTLMCQSIGIPARLVQGFRCDECNPFGGRYIVQASQAHAWVEVLTPDGWITYDPTSGREQAASRSRGLWGTLKHFFDYLEYKWAEAVVAYDSRERDRIIHTLDTVLTNSLIRASDFFRDLGRIPYTTAFWNASLGVINFMIWGLALCIVAAIAFYLVQQYRLRRRAARIGLEALPVPQRIRLAKQLAFFDRLMRLLYRVRIVRPRHLTNMEFANSLVYLPAQTYSAIRRLTELFYRVRFGGDSITPARQRRLEAFVAQLDTALPKLPRPRPSG